MRWLNPSAVLNLRNLSMALVEESATFDFDVPGELRFTRMRTFVLEIPPVLEKCLPLCARLALRPFGNQKTVAPGTTVLVSSREWIRTTPQKGLCDPWVMPTPCAV